jgi:hypothetical protein
MSPKKPGRLREPIQVYLSAEDRAMLDRVAKSTGLSRAEILRRGIRRMSAEAIADEHPGLKFMRKMIEHPWPELPPPDLSDPHQRYEEELMEAYLDRHAPKDNS